MERSLNVPSHMEFPIFEFPSVEGRKWKCGRWKVKERLSIARRTLDFLFLISKVEREEVQKCGMQTAERHVQCETSHSSRRRDPFRAKRLLQ